MSATQNFTVRDFEPGDEVALLRAAQRVLGDDAGSADVWRWRYRDNPAGCAISVGLVDDEVVAHVAGLSVPVTLAGKPQRFLSVSRPFVDPTRARELGRRGMLGELVEHFHKLHLGAEPDQSPVAFGFPDRPLWRRATRFGGYNLVSTPNILIGTADTLASDGSQGVEVSEVERFPEDIEAVHDALSGYYQAVTHRTAGYLDWRFAAHPKRPYRMAVARSGGAPSGLAVFRTSFDGDNTQGVLCDWAVPPGDGATAAALRGWLVDCLRREGCAQLLAVLPDMSPDWLDFQRAGMKVRGTDLVLAARNQQRKLTMHWLRHHWYTTLADTDLC